MHVIPNILALLERKKGTRTVASYEDVAVTAYSIKEAPKAPIAFVGSVPEELKKYKELLDIGVITQKEFEVKKKELLGL